MFNNFAELYKYRELLLTLTLREIKVRYKQTMLGAAWAIIQPLSLMIIFTIVFSLFLKVDSGEIPYPIFSYSALLPWTFFATSLSFGAIAIINNSNLVSKVYFPRETLPLASLLAAFVDFIIASLLFVGLAIFYETPLSVNILFVVPIIIIQLIFSAAVVLLSSAIVVVFRDIKFVVPLLVQLWIFATPVIYPLSQVPQNLRLFYILDPMAVIVENFRTVTIGGKPPNFFDLTVAAIVSLVAFWLSYSYFKKKERTFADII